MKCPVCKTVSLEAAEVDRQLPTHACSSCGGQWVKVEEYLKWLDLHGPNLPEKSPDQAVNLPVNDSKPGKLCPACGAFLIRHLVGHGVSFHLDRCGRCGGFWLDRNEWEILKSRNLHDDVHYIFSEVWQSQARHQEQRAQYEGAVVKILDDKLRQVCGDGDLTRLKEIKAWLDGDPHSQDLYAYLASTRTPR